METVENPKREAYSLLLHKVLAVDSFPKLESRIVSQEGVGQWDHLFDIVDQQDAGSDSQILLLIGQDHPEILRPLETQHGVLVLDGSFVVNRIIIYSEPVNFVEGCRNSTVRRAVLPPDDQQYMY